MKRTVASHQAFTLIETIIAMSLLSMLMAIIWTMFSIYTKLETKGVARADEAGLVRAISRQIRRDLLHIVGIDKLRGVAIHQQTDSKANRFPTNGYLVGTSTGLHFLVCVEPELPDAADCIRLISYEPHSVADDQRDDLGSDEALVEPAEQLEFAFSDEYGTPLGIDRHDRSWSSYWKRRTATDSKDEILSTNRPVVLDADDFIQVGKQFPMDESKERRYLEAEDTTDEIPELARLSFRYFDGGSWTSQWDSTASGRLPLAMEVGFDLEMVKKDSPESDQQRVLAAEDGQTPTGSGPEDRRAAALADAGTMSVGGQDEFDGASLTEYRFVVSIPAARVPQIRDPESGDNEDVEEPPIIDGNAQWLPLPLGVRAVFMSLLAKGFCWVVGGRATASPPWTAIHATDSLTLELSHPVVLVFRQFSKPDDLNARGVDFSHAVSQSESLQ